MTDREYLDRILTIARSKNDADTVARVELARAYFTNPTFRKALEAHVWAINHGD